MDAPHKTEPSERIREELKQLKEYSHSANFDLKKSETMKEEDRDGCLDNLAYMAPSGGHFSCPFGSRDVQDKKIFEMAMIWKILCETTFTAT